MKSAAGGFEFLLPLRHLNPVSIIRCWGVAVCGSRGFGEARCGGAAMWGSYVVGTVGLGELRCGGLVVWGSCVVGE